MRRFGKVPGNHRNIRSYARTSHLQPVPAAGRPRAGVVRSSRPDRGNALRLDLREPVSLPRVLGQPVCGQGLLSTAPAPGGGRQQAGDAAAQLHQSRGEAAHRGDDGPSDQSHVQGFGAGRGAPGVVPPRPRWRAALAARDRSDRSAQVHRVGRPRGDRIRQSEHAPGAGRVLGGAGRAPPEARLQGVPLRCRLSGAGRGVAADRAPGEGARSGVPLLRRDARLHAAAGAGAARGRLRLPVQQRQVVGLPRALAARAV